MSWFTDKISGHMNNFCYPFLCAKYNYLFSNLYVESRLVILIRNVPSPVSMELINLLGQLLNIDLTVVVVVIKYYDNSCYIKLTPL